MNSRMLQYNRALLLIFIVGVYIVLTLFPLLIHDLNANNKPKSVENHLKIAKITQPFTIVGNQGWLDFKNDGNCTGEGTYSNPYVIEDLLIDGEETGIIIEIEQSDVYFIIRNCTLYNGGYGIYCYNVSNGIYRKNYISNCVIGIDFHWYCENNTIVNNQLYNNENTGLFLYGASHWNKIYQNNISNNAYKGIEIFNSRRNEVIGNNITENGDGLELIGLSNNNIIFNNCISNSNHYGIYIRSRYNEILSNKIHHNGESGLYITNHNNTIKMNKIYNNTDGVLIGFAESNNITQNIIRDNLDCGIRANAVFNYNLFYNNTVIRSGVLNAYVCDGINYWNSSVMGNYWDDYGGLDTNDDGIGDTPYMIISENIHKYDYLPIWFDGPTFNIIKPKNHTIFTSNLKPPSFSLRIHDPNLDAIWYTINLGEEKYFTEANGTLDYNSWIHLMNGNITLRFYANDTHGNININQIILVKETQSPEMLVFEPNEGAVYGIEPPSYNLTITDLPFNSTWYTLDNGLTNYTTFNIFSNNTTGFINQSAWDSFQESPITINFYGIDIIGRVYFSKVNIYKDVAIPIININAPILNSSYGESAPQFDITIIEGNLISMWYTINEGEIINFSSSTGTINQAIWSNLLDGPVSITFYATDIAGNEIHVQLDVEKDTTAPLIIINSPTLSEFFSTTSPSFDITVEEINLDSMWYTIDNGITNISLTGLSGTIDQTAWISTPDGQINIRFYANDTLGNENYMEIAVNKDLVPPEITIITPETDQEFQYIPPAYLIGIDEGNLESYWYTIDNGMNNYTITSLTGTIDVTAWNNLAEGPVTIQFYARDLAGNIGSSSVTIIKEPSESEPPPYEGIPGYNLIALLGITLAVTLTLTRKRLKK